jgi:hypothetical protein
MEHLGLVLPPPRVIPRVYRRWAAGTPAAQVPSVVAEPVSEAGPTTVAAAAVFYLLDVVIRTLLPTRHM